MNLRLEKIKETGTGMAFILYPLLAGFAFAVHPNLLSISIEHNIQNKIAEFHNNSTLHFGHFLMLLGAPLLVIIALHFMNRIQEKGKYWVFWGGIIAITGAFVLIVDKTALCLVPSALDSLPEASFQAAIPAIEAIFAYKGWLWIIWLLPLLPIGFVIQSVGILKSGLLPKNQSLPILIGAFLMANPDIDIIGLAATILLGITFIPYGFSLIQSALNDNTQTQLQTTYKGA